VVHPNLDVVLVRRRKAAGSRSIGGRVEICRSTGDEAPDKYGMRLDPKAAVH
jgi:hypothetical protein